MMFPLQQQIVYLLLVFTLLLSSAIKINAADWTRFRGAGGAGISEEQGMPVVWSADDYDWDIELPGVGHSSPIVVGDNLFVTSAIDEGALRLLFCLDATTGKKRWMRSIGMSKSRKHAKGSFASSTPTTDGKQVYVVFADEERCYLSAYDFNGNLAWRRATVSNEHVHGQGVSPVLFDDLVILAADKEGPSSCIAYNKETGKTVWSRLRDVRRTSYATPFILRRTGKPPELIVTSGAMGITSLAPNTGVLNWQSGEMPLRTVASPVYGSGLIFQTCGGGGSGKLLIGVNPDTQKANAENNTTSADVSFQLKKNLPYVPTPVFYQGHLFLWCDNGVVSCIEFPAGKNIWTKRVGGKYSSSPVCIGGKLYCITEEGEVVVIAASPKYKLLGKTDLNDPSHAMVVVAGERIYLRSFHRLKAVKRKKK